MTPLSEKVRKLREAKGWTQEEMARAIGVTLSTIQRWEKQGGRPALLARRALARHFRQAGISDEEEEPTEPRRRKRSR